MRQDERRGLLYAGLGFLIFPIGDTVVKTMAGQWAPTAIAATRYTIGAFGLAVLLSLREGRGGFALPRPAIQLMRGVGVAGATGCFFAALMFMPQAEATTLTFTQPVVTALLAIAFLGEKARKEIWIASLIASIGVLAVLQPTFANVGWAIVLPLTAASFMSMMMVGNRLSAGLASALSMQFTVASVAAIALVAATFLGHVSGMAALQVEMPAFIIIAKCAFVALNASIGHWLVYKGTTMAGASTIAPMTYLQLVGATVAGWLIFDHRPTLAVFAGALLIVGSGLYMWWKGRAEEPVELP